MQTKNKTVREIVWHSETVKLTYTLRRYSVNLVNPTVLASFYHLLLVSLVMSSNVRKTSRKTGYPPIEQDKLYDIQKHMKTGHSHVQLHAEKNTMKTLLFKLNLARQNFIMHKRSPISNTLSTTLIRYRKRSTKQVFTLRRAKHGTRHTRRTTELPYYLSPTPVIPTADRASGKHHDSLNHDTPAWRSVRMTSNEGWGVRGCAEDVV